MMGAKNYNLSMTDGNDRVLMHCFSRNCDPKDILERAGLHITYIYYQQLTPTQAKNHKSIVNDRVVRCALEVELIIIFQWLSASNKVLFPCDEEVSRERVMDAFRRVKGGCSHYLAEGIK